MVIACAALYCYPDEEGGARLCCSTPGLPPAHTRRQAAGTDEHGAAAVTQLFVLTTQTAHWFRERGFEPTKLEDLPMEKQEL